MAKILFILYFIFSVSIIAISASSDVVRIEGLGSVEGKINGELIGYIGIPFSEPPVGPLRFKAPQPGKPWSDLFFANRTVACIQAAPTPVLQDEDCLTLNIFRSINSVNSQEKLPVLVFIHGGAWKIGSSHDHYINATYYTTKENVIVVSINYRLDLLAYLAHAALTAEEPRNPTNFGLLDQRMALHWVSQHIAAFNGDPNRVTAMGVSAGAQSIVAHIRAWREYKPKFQQAILMSSYALGTVVPLATAEEIGDEMVDVLGCKKNSNKEIMECLRSLPAEELTIHTRNQRLLGFGEHWSSGAMHLVDDGVNFKASDRLLRDFELDMPLIIGVTANEGTLLSMMNHPLTSQTEEDYHKYLNNVATAYEPISKAVADRLIEKYSANVSIFAETIDPVFSASAELYSDLIFECASYGLLKSLSNRQNVYGYLFNYSADPSSRLKAAHGSDGPFAMGPSKHSNIFGTVSQTEEEQQFAIKIATYYAAFMKTGAPLAPGQVTWPGYSKKGNLLVLAPEFKVINNHKEETCNFWIENLPHGFQYTGADYHVDESFLSKLLNKSPFDLVLFLWRKRRFWKPALAVLSLITVAFWYKVIRACCWRRKKSNPAKRPAFNDRQFGLKKKKST